ncbi:ATP-binding cassette domain-containing protein [Nostocoides sp. F2B08]|uniref:metal ABC transporter ATP-binding protein n=1 Tax=Nostocoides sp. F2B08 TaxID=2653936 RepID=UPI00126356CD|nr:metal ABC transporter ATP-binding protein [Tetrasphaera sp. F2B08]KAB7744726.1 ATP-binding cassette domain-containing protein [Tetrasphaera sp. F2B08]
MTPSTLVLRDAAFGYADRRVVAGVSLTVEPGDVVALLGPNGSGKSTIVRGVLGLAEHLGGEVEVLGTPLAQLSDRTSIGYVPQHHSLSTSVSATVREVVACGRLPHRPWWRRAGAEDRRLVDEAIETVGLTDRAREEVSHLSGGQQRRVLIARALAAQPSVLLMDEPTAGVDTANQHILADVLGRLAATGTTMLIVTHELDAVRDIVSRVVCVSAGHIDFDGTSAEYALHTSAHAIGSDHHHIDEDVVRVPSTPPGSGPLDSATTRSTA